MPWEVEKFLLLPFDPELDPAPDCCVWWLPRGLNGNSRVFPKTLLGFAFCSSPLLFMLVVSPERLSCVLELLMNRCQPSFSISLIYLVPSFSCSLVTSHRCPQHCWTKVPPVPQGKSLWVRVESLWDLVLALLGGRTPSPPVPALMPRPVLCR